MSDANAVKKPGHRRGRQDHHIMLPTHRLQQTRYLIDLAV
jgi:hypothetical protein